MITEEWEKYLNLMEIKPSDYISIEEEKTHLKMLVRFAIAQAKREENERIRKIIEKATLLPPTTRENTLSYILQALSQND